MISAQDAATIDALRQEEWFWAQQDDIIALRRRARELRHQADELDSEAHKRQHHLEDQLSNEVERRRQEL